MALTAAWITGVIPPAFPQTFDVSLNAELDRLGDTGWDPRPLLLLAVALIVAGIGLLASTRRRPASRPAEQEVPHARTT